MSNKNRVTLPRLVAALMLLSGTATALPLVKINEVVGSTVGTDVEFVELYGTPGASLNGYSLLIVSGLSPNMGKVLQRLDFTSQQIAASGPNAGFFLLGDPNLINQYYGVAVDYALPQNYIINSPYTILLVPTALTAPTPGSTMTGKETYSDAIFITDATDPLGDVGNVFRVPVIGPDGTALAAGAARLLDGVDTGSAADWALADFNIVGNTPGASNCAGGCFAQGTSVPEPSGLALFGLGFAGLGWYGRRSIRKRT